MSKVKKTTEEVVEENTELQDEITNPVKDSKNEIPESEEIIDAKIEETHLMTP